ncbi:MAG: chromosome segregation protein SMC [Candidatus Omnitrophica bacterium]|nr:chromosome segregation protein SMC [Candidatus Omnitrophota bacterium]
MFFKSLELYGFKSFAEKTKLDFQAGVTAVVGPNGCGKSNISDAIRWVLGEQSVRNLRGSRMEDVIFHGADNISAVGFAEVSLTIANQNNFLPLEYDEVTLTRRIYRSGESEYLINKVPVRLKDISELLMGTGLGVPSYSLIEQGKVDRILHSHPEERREIFEEAAGITKYRSKREEALRKLERTNENLQRIGDIIVEVKRQIKSMERQVNKARRYKEEFEKLKEYELKVSQHQFIDLKKERQELEKRVRQLENEEATSGLQMNSTAHSLEKSKEELAQIEENISGIRAKNYELEAKLKTGQNKSSLDKERIEELTRRSQDAAMQIDELKKKIDTVTESVENAQKTIEEIARNRQEKLTLLAEKEQSINDVDKAIEEAHNKISGNKAQEVELIAQHTRCRNEQTKLAANLGNLNARLRRLRLESEKTQEDITSVEEKYQACNKDLEALDDQTKKLTKEIWDFKSNLNLQVEKKEKLQERTEELSHKITSLDSKRHFLQEITKNYEGFSSGVKALLAAKEKGEFNLAGFCGVVANLIEVQPEYQIAVEMALGEKAQALVMESIQAADQAIDYLQAKDAGRAQIICLENIASNVVKQLKPSMSLGQVQDVIKTEPRYQKLLDYLLADTYIVEDKQAAYQALKEQGFGHCTFVTPKGALIREASLIDGSLPKDMDSSLLGREARIAEVQVELEKAMQEKGDLENLITFQDDEIQDINNKVQEREPQLHALKIKLANRQVEKDNIESEKTRYQEETEVLKLETEETNEQVEQLHVEEDNLNQELQRLDQEQEKIQTEIKDLQGHVSGQEHLRQNTLVEIAQTKAQLEAQDKEEKDARLRLKMILDSCDEQKASKQIREQELEENQKKIEQLTEEITQLESEQRELGQTKLNIEKELDQALHKRLDLSGGIDALEKKVKEQQKALDVLRENKSSIQIKLTETSYKQSSLGDKMQQSYQVDLSATLEDAVELSPLEDNIFEEIVHLKSRLEGIGPVNLVAIEENDQLQQRYDFLISQQEDLIQAQESLRKAITQINRTAREMFAQTFQQIQQSFKDYFRILFGGGDARLILLDDNNILESGIEIVVRPPGKKLQNISLLSGGEKALTAISLLFAVFKVKPSPFCILDEVDAPLDEANIDRFTNLLSEFIKTSQFIIVTHNKKTMNMADIMYGITMQTSGISKIVSVRFTDQKKETIEEVAGIEG